MTKTIPHVVYIHVHVHVHVMLQWGQLCEINFDERYNFFGMDMIIAILLVWVWLLIL